MSEGLELPKQGSGSKESGCCTRAHSFCFMNLDLSFQEKIPNSIQKNFSMHKILFAKKFHFNNVGK